jgi:hypothetical protein
MIALVQVQCLNMIYIQRKLSLLDMFVQLKQEKAKICSGQDKKLATADEVKGVS